VTLVSIIASIWSHAGSSIFADPEVEAGFVLPLTGQSIANSRFLKS